MNDDLLPLLATLPEPAAPPSITATVMARIEREVAERQVDAGSPVRRRHANDLTTWITAAAGIALVLGATATGWYYNGVPDLFSPRFLRGGLVAALAGWQASLVGLLGLGLGLRALFAPLRARR